SIEDKIVKFPSKSRHQLFLEPEGYDTHEVYLNGFSTSLPSDLQHELVHQIRGLEEARIIRPGYAIEYDFIDPRELTPFLQTSRFKGLFFAGQINGTTGYEEAACQGLIAGINASLFVQGREGFRLGREESYIGVLIDDLITHGVDEPYRMFTSRAEYRLQLRYDTADARLTSYGHELGLIGDDGWQKFLHRRNRISQLRLNLESTRFNRTHPEYSYISTLLNKDLGDSFTLSSFVHNPGITPEIICQFLPANLQNGTSLSELESALADVLYAGYITFQQNNIERLYHSDSVPIPNNFKFGLVSGLSNEMVERLERTAPQTFGQARHIPGLTPGALTTLLYHLKLN
ncbi:MAG TPA: FAD-dependent oxidoreductase, partial [Pedobacter sp.]